MAGKHISEHTHSHVLPSQIHQSEWDSPYVVMIQVAQGPNSLMRSGLSLKSSYTRLATAAATDQVQSEIRRMGTTVEGQALLLSWSQLWADEGFVPPWEAGSRLTVSEIIQMLEEREEARRDPFDLDIALDNEVQRRRKLLGPCLDQSYDYETARERARLVGVPFRVFHQWLKTYQQVGELGLRPDHWVPLSKGIQNRILEIYLQLGELADAEFVSDDQIEARAIELGWKGSRLKEWLERYRGGGLWKLGPSNNPRKGRRIKRAERRPRAYGTLTAAAIKTMFDRMEMLGELAYRRTVSDDEMIARAEEVGVSVRTLWEWRGLYQEFDVIGLAPLQRSDKHKRHNLSDEMVLFIEGVRVSKPDCPDHEVYSIACREARRCGEVEPTPWQVRSICEHIRKADKLVADGRDREFRNRFRFTGPIDWNNAEKVVWQIDHTPVDVLVKDCRRQKDQAKSGQTRLYLTSCKDARSGIVLAARFTYERPDRFVIAAVIRDAILRSDTKPYGGIPDEIWVDRGKEMISDLIRQLCRMLNIKLFETRRPELKGKVERLFRIFNTLLWSKQPGYVNSNTVLRNPNAKAELLPTELIERFWAFVEWYNNHVNKKTKLSRLEYWFKNCFTREVDPRLLDMILMDACERKMGKEFFSYNGGHYTHKLLSDLVGEKLVIRGTPYLDTPPEVEVFYNDQWVCTAFKMDEEGGRILDPEDLKAAQQSQRAAITKRNTTRRAAVEAAEQETIAKTNTQSSVKPTKPKQPPKTSSTTLSKPKMGSDILKYETIVG